MRIRFDFPFIVGLLFFDAAYASNQFTLNSALPISSNGTQIWRHPTSENYYIEVRECNLCVGQDLWSGFFHSVSEQISIFFIFARSSTVPESSPLALWSNGGPGTSAVSMAFSRATGCVLEEDYRGMRLSYKPHGSAKPWNEKLNVVFIEQPVGTGFSRGSGKAEEDTRVGAEYIYEFIQVILARHPRIPDVSLHSLSYGGHFVPEWTKKIVDENIKVRAGRSINRIIPLKSVTMGNSWFGADIQYLSRFDLLCESHPYIPISGPLLSPTECKRVSSHRSICADLLKQCRENPSDNCAAAHLWCLTSLMFHCGETGRNMYHLSDFATTLEGYDTYPALSKYLNLRPVQLALGVITPDDLVPRKWIFHSTRVSTLHTLAGDHIRRTDDLLPAILEAGIDVLIYQGMLDWACNAKGVRSVIESQGLVNGDISHELRNWRNGSGRYYCSKKAKGRGSGQFCYLEIDKEGHSVAIEYDEWPNILENWVLEGSL